ncbi:TIGR04222 domain-containing membrane protein [Streptomyces sp. NPDC005728]|uniref:TIGR04222 domain-containing membrane protein n=1 Tax=Streptomyces sp. NPDC005728 TaxID=3157054 RepID=UPI0033FAC301
MDQINFVVLGVAAVVLAACAVYSGRAARRVRAAVVSPRGPDPVADLYEIAYLQGGAGGLCVTVAVRMRDTGRLSVSGTGEWITVEPAGCRPQDDVEAAFTDAAVRKHAERYRSRGLPWVGTDDEYVRRIRDRLVAEGLLNDPDRTRDVLIATDFFGMTILCSPVLIGAAAVLARLGGGSYWILLGYAPLLVGSFLLWVRDLGCRPGPSPLGLRAVELARAGTWAPDPHPGPDRGDPALLGRVALDGPGVLPKSHPLAPPPPPPEPEYVIRDAPGLGGL